MTTLIQPSRGVYDANRATALAGVPKSTLHYWARHEILVPKVAGAPRTRLWSWGDLLLLRLVSWLRTEKEDAATSTMREVRTLLQIIEHNHVPPEEWSRRVAVSASGHTYFENAAAAIVRARTGQLTLGTILDLTKPFEAGPDLLVPRPTLRIFPGKLSGEPHVHGTRVMTSILFALHARGYSSPQIRDMYPEIELQAIEEAIDLERSLLAA